LGAAISEEEINTIVASSQKSVGWESARVEPKGAKSTKRRDAKVIFGLMLLLFIMYCLIFFMMWT
jgi:hypothetical protein